MKKKLLLFLVLVFVCFSLVPTFYELQESKNLSPLRSFELVHNYITDYNFYLSRIREGWDGRWTAVERYTSEPHAGSLVQELYIIIGQIARPFHDSDVAVPAAYHIARIGFGVLLVSSIAWVASIFFSSTFWAVLAFLLAVTASGWPKIVSVGEALRIGGYMPWWTVLDALQRITFLPHILLGQALIVYLIIAGGSQERIQKHRVFVLGILVLVLGFVFPPGYVFVLFVYGVIALFERFLDSSKTKKNWKQWFTASVLPRLIIGCIGLPSLLYFGVLFTHYPWKRLIEFDQLHPTSFEYWEYIKAVGPILLSGILGAAVVIIKKEKRWYPIVAWGFSVFVLVYLFTIVPIQHPLRFTEMAVFIPLGLLTAYASFFIVSVVKRHRASPYVGVGSIVVPFILILLGLGTMHSSWLWQKDFVDQKIGAGQPVIAMDNYIVYPIQEFIDGLTYINTSVPSGSIVLSDLVAGNYIVARTGRTVYLGHDNTVRREEKEAQVRKFFSGALDEKQAYQWMKQERISYVFVGPQENRQGKGIDLGVRYPFLRKEFHSNPVSIYRVLP